MWLSPYVNFITNHLDKAYIINNVVQAGAERYKVKDTNSFQRVHKVQTIFNSINIGFVLWTLKQLYNELNSRYLISRIFLYDPKYLISLLFVFGPSWWFGTNYIVSKINELTKPKEDLEQWHTNLPIHPQALNDIKVSWDTPYSQKLIQISHVTQIVISIALIFFSSAPLFFAISAALQLYALKKVTSCKWIRFDRSFAVLNNDPSNGPQKFTVSYFFPIIALKSSEKDKPISPLCSEHPMDRLSLIRQVYEKSATFLQNFEFNRSVVSKEYGFNVKNYIKYDVYLLKNNIPSCSVCNHLPSHNILEVEVEDIFYGTNHAISAQVSLI